MSESPSRIEPCGIEEMIPEALSDLVVQIRQEASEIGRGLPTQTLRDLRGLVRIMNAYYSNLIEGHNTRPRDIEAALRGEAVENRPLAEEAAAHVRVQEWIDGLADAGNLPSPVSVEFIAAVHARFYAEMPDEFRHVKQNGRQVDIVPGVFRAVHVQVGRHLPPAPDAVPAFMTYFAQRYTSLTRGATGRILAIPAAHHRLNFIHPFLDGNGRVSRLISHAMIRSAGIGAAGLWSISRSLARGLEDRGEYKRWMDAADGPRRGDRDGCGNLSQTVLNRFTQWFLAVMLDQICFTRAMFDLEHLAPRYDALIRDTTANDTRAPSHRPCAAPWRNGTGRCVTGGQSQRADRP